MFLLLKYTLLYTVVLMMVALGGMFSERSGIINIALEGIMVIGGLMGVIAIQMMPAGASAFSIVLVPVLAAGIACMLYAGLLAFASINLNADQTIGGTALNLLATALAMVIAKGVNHSASAKLDYSNRVFVYEFGPLTVNARRFIGIVALIPLGLSGLIRRGWVCACVRAASIRRRRTAWASTSTRCAISAC